MTDIVSLAQAPRKEAIRSADEEWKIAAYRMSHLPPNVRMPMPLRERPPAGTPRLPDETFRANAEGRERVVQAVRLIQMADLEKGLKAKD